MRKLCAAGAVALAIVTGTGFNASKAVGAGAPNTRRVLVLSLPTVGWRDVERGGMPNLRRLLRGAAVGSLTTTGVISPTPLGDTYVSLGAGTRATADPLVVGQGYDVDEDFGDTDAATAYRTRTGAPAAEGIVYLPIASVVAANDAESYRARVGLLGDTLAAHAFRTAVVGNGDGADPSTPERLYPSDRRASVAALMSSVGRVSAGEVDRGLLQDDATAPFGVRLDPARVAAAFDAAWQPRSVVLVEGSDLVRADIQGLFASGRARQAMRNRALRDTDRLVGRLLDRVDLKRDAVVVVGMAPPADGALTVAAVRAPGFGSGLLKSRTTGRAGYVNVVDVAPTVLDLLDLSVPGDMEGRVASRVSSDTPLATRVERMSRADADSKFAADQATAAVAVLIGVGIALALLAMALADRVAGARAALAFGARWLVGFLVAAALATPFHFGRHGGATAFWLFVAGVASVLALVDALAARRTGNAVDPLLAALGTLVAVLLVDTATGAHLQLDGVLGYIAASDWRIGGISDLAFAELAAGSALFAGLLAWRVPERKGVAPAVGVLAVTALVVGFPGLGGSFDGLVVLLVGFGPLAWFLLDRRLRPAAALGALVALVVVAGGIAYASDSDRALDDARRTLSVNATVGNHSPLVLMVVVVAVLVAYFWWVPPRSLRRVAERVTMARATALAVVVVALLGFLVNDPRVSIPGMMAVVLESVIVHVVARTP